ncbi:MAG: exodeoxyribonuclease VII large subunit, partial [Gemmatimonadota bacterium]|nr:exodeoxyribonuclease VII large subunit [Gemmatimonadota bacterium]
VPIVSAVGHEEDIALTDLVADVRAPTPSAAAEAVVPDREEVTRALDSLAKHLGQLLTGRTRLARERLERTGDRIQGSIQRIIDRATGQMAELAATLDALSPLKVLERGYSVARDGEGKVLSSVKDFVPGGKFRLTVSDGDIDAAVEEKSI